MSKKINPDEISIYGEIKKETEKAILFINQWIPKSQISYMDKENNVIVVKEWVINKNGWTRTVMIRAQRISKKYKEAENVDWREVALKFADKMKEF